MRTAPRDILQSRSAGWSRRIAGFSAILFAIAAASHRFGLLETTPFLGLLALVASLAGLAFLAGMVGFVRIWQHGERGFGSAMWGMLLGLAVLAPFAVSASDYLRYPMLNDVSTDTADPPSLSVAKRLRTPAMNTIGPATSAAAAEQAAAYPGLSGRRYEFAQEEVVDAVKAVIADHGWTVTGSTQAAGAGQTFIEEATATTLLLGFVDDVAIRVEGRDGATFVDMRSASRYGRHDLGENARRIQGFMADLDARMQAMTGT